MPRIPAAGPLLLLLASCTGGEKVATSKYPSPAEFIAGWEQKAVPLWTAWQQAEWDAHLHVRDNDASFAETAAEAMLAWETEVGKPEWLTETRDVIAAAEDLIQKAEKLDKEERPPLPRPIELDALEQIRAISRSASTSGADLRAKMRRDLALLLRTRDASLPKLDNTPMPPDEVEGRLRAATTDAERTRLWRATLTVARDLKPAYGSLRDVRNQIAQKEGFEDHLASSLSELHVKPDEWQAMMHEAEVALRPLFRQLHTWVRYELAARYNVSPVPDQIPVQWLDDPLGGTWSGPFTMSGLDPAEGLATRGVQNMLRDADGFFTSTGLPPLSPEVWGASSLYPVERGARYEKTPGASTWDIDLGEDVRILLSATAHPAWMHAAHREIAYAHALVERDRAKVPTPIRVGSPRLLETSLAMWADFAASKPSRLASLGVLRPADMPDETFRLLDDALVWLPFVPFAAGTVAAFESEVYADGLAVDRMTGRWWELALEHQGIAPPETRTERWADPLYLSGLVDMPGRYAELGVAVLLAFQFHDHLCAEAGLDPRTADLTGATTAGPAFRKLAVASGAGDWREAVEKQLGAAPSADAMVRYFEPLTSWLTEQNDGRNITMPKL